MLKNNILYLNNSSNLSNRQSSCLKSLIILIHGLVRIDKDLISLVNPDFILGERIKKIENRIG